MSFESKGLKYLSALSGLDKEISTGIRFGLYNFGTKLRKDIKAAILKKNKTGRIYNIRRGNRRIRHRASAKGEAPANLSGNLRASVGFEVKGVDLKIGYRDKSSKGNPVDYGKRLEVDLERNAIEQAINGNASDFKDFILKGIHGKVFRKIQQGRK